MENYIYEPADGSPAYRIDALQTLIVQYQEEIEETEARKTQVRYNLSLNAKEQTILNIGLDIALVKLNRNINRAKAALATQKMDLMKKTFWHSI